MKHQTWVVIPAYNEQKHIGEVVRRAGKHADRVVVVDDGSRDNTGKAAEKAGADVIRHITNIGKGAALKTGCDYAALNKAENIVKSFFFI